MVESDMLNQIKFHQSSKGMVESDKFRRYAIKNCISSKKLVESDKLNQIKFKQSSKEWLNQTSLEDTQ